MGYYSYVKDSDYEVKDMKGLRQWKKIKIEKEEQKSIWESVNLEQNGSNIFDMFNDGWKIIGYWYKDILIFFRDLAMFVEGFLLLEAEDEEAFARITFKDGDVEVDLAELNWKKITLKELGCPELSKEESTLRKL